MAPHFGGGGQPIDSQNLSFVDFDFSFTHGAEFRITLSAANVAFLKCAIIQVRRKARKSRTAVTRFPKLLHVERMASVVKLHCGIRHIGQRRQWAEGCRLPQRKMGTAAVLQARSQPIDTNCNGYDLEYGALAFSIGISAEPDHTEPCFPHL